MPRIYDNIAGLYGNRQNRENTALNIIKFSLQVVEETYKIKHLDNLTNELKKEPIQMNLMPYHYNDLVDNFRIIVCFENFMAAKLILNGYVVHKLERSIAAPLNPYVAPVKISDLKRIRGYTLDASNRLNFDWLARDNRTIGMKEMLMPAYQTIIKLPASLQNSIKNINKLRNNHHLLTNSTVEYGDDKLREIRAILKFINNKIIKTHNRLNDKLGYPNHKRKDLI